MSVGVSTIWWTRADADGLYKCATLLHHRGEAIPGIESESVPRVFANDQNPICRETADPAQCSG
jgi:hypothetical protein